MNAGKLLSRQTELVSHLLDCGYSLNYVEHVKRLITLISKNATRWMSYASALDAIKQMGYSKDYYDKLRIILKAIEQFDLYDRFPEVRIRQIPPRADHHLFLCPEFSFLIDLYGHVEEARNLGEYTIYVNSRYTATFLCFLQQKGENSLKAITERSVLSFFTSKDGAQLKSYSSKQRIAAVLRVGLSWKEKECQRILSFLPSMRSTRKNIQFLTQREVVKIRAALDDLSNALTYRDRAIGMLLVFTGLRSVDIAALKLDSIDWDKQTLCITQQKTKAPLELPLPTIVGNAIYDYLNSGRPNIDSPNLFLTARSPYGDASSKAITSNTVNKIMREANIRQKPKDRKGTHLFRHMVATSLLENGISQPIISHTLGHTSCESLTPYLHADFLHLKECSLSIEHFPITEEVFQGV